MKRTTALSLAVVAAAAAPAAIVAGASAATSTAPTGNIPAVASDAGFSTLVTLVKDAGLAGALPAPSRAGSTRSGGRFSAARNVPDKPRAKTRASRAEACISGCLFLFAATVPEGGCSTNGRIA